MDDESSRFHNIIERIFTLLWKWRESKTGYILLLKERTGISRIYVDEVEDYAFQFFIFARSKKYGMVVKFDVQNVNLTVTMRNLISNYLNIFPPRDLTSVTGQMQQWKLCFA